MIKLLRVVFRPEARADLRNIYLYLVEETRDRGVARRYTDRIYERCRSITNAPNGGAPRGDLASGLRMVTFERSIIVLYMPYPKSVQIVRILHGRRNIAALFRDPP